ncbi:hypothetical protein ACHAW5_006276 [Stephanodiscus triporus]|uniref:Peptidase M14 domain-containing protein n=1 Tax=Stephanodiscus triporus TaxID=2934178 RepID=A0ABD3NUH1_9STRA
MQAVQRMIRPLVAVFAILISTTTTATAVTNTGNASAIPFPRVYVADILTPEKDPSNFSRFADEVDLLGFDHVTDLKATISFVVHDEEELDRLLLLAKTPKTETIGGTIDMDMAATEDLRKQIEFKGEGEMGPQSASVYAGEMGPQSNSVYATIANYPCYKSLQGSFDWMDDMVEKAKNITGLSVMKSDIGDSYYKTENATSGYDILALKITGNLANVTTKGIFFIMSGIHPRELTPPELASRWVNILINGYGVDADITAMLDSTEIHVVPQSNPDARQVAETNPAAMRRKSMNPGNSTCDGNPNKRGVDLNRNFPYQWGLEPGSSGDPCAETYRGASAGSEPEVRAIMDYTKAIFPSAQRKTDPQASYPESTTMGVFVDIHAFGNLILSPWRHSTTVISPNRDAITAISDKIQYFTNYGTSLGYTSAGTTVDYAFKDLGTASATIELGTAFYQDCATFEEIIWPLIRQPLMFLAKISMAPYTMGKGPDVTALSASVFAEQLTITAAASDSAWSKNKVSTSQQAVTEIRAWVNVHPYSLNAFDQNNTGYVLGNGSVTVNVSLLASGRHTVYVQAKDSADYRGPNSHTATEPQTNFETVRATEPQTNATPNVKAYDTQAYDTQAYDTQAYDTQAYDTQAYDTQAYDTQAYNTQAYNTQAYDTQACDTQA